MNNPAKVVSSDLEDLTLVDADDQDIGTMAKRDCHLDAGVLHRAFSVLSLIAPAMSCCSNAASKNFSGRFIGPMPAAATHVPGRTQ